MNIVLQPRSALTGTVGQRSNLLLKFLPQFPLNLIPGGLVKIAFVGGNLEVRVDMGDIIAFNVFQPADGDLTAVAALSGTGIAARIGAEAWALRTLAAPAAGLTITNPAGIAGNPTFAFANDLGAIEALSGTGFPERTGIDTWAMTGFTGTGVVARANAPTFVGTVTIDFGGGTAGATNALAAQNGSAFGAFIIPKASAGAFNPGVAANDTLFYFSGGAIDTGILVIGPHSNNNVGLRLDTSGVYSRGQWGFRGPLSPAQITADQDNYNPAGLATATVLRLNSDATRNITGLAGGADGRIVIIHNVGATNAIVLKDEGAGSTAANRFALTADITLTADAVTLLQYDSTSTRWRAVGGSGSGGGASTTEAYVTIGNTAGLSAERALTAGQGITITDAGANNTVTVETVNGSVLQTLQSTYTTNAALATTIPFDDTIPQSTEGVQILSQAITPADNTNKVLCRVSVWGCTDFSTSFSIIAALFRGTTCINVAAQTNPGADSPSCVQFEFLDSPASASAQTYTVRVGAETGSAIRLNGTTGARRFGGTSACTLTVEEIKA